MASVGSRTGLRTTRTPAAARRSCSARMSRTCSQIITDARLVAAVIDRVTFNAHIIETGTDSYRHRTSRTRRPRTGRDG